MGRGARVRGVAALGAVLGTSLLFCASAWAKMPQTITFTSTPPSTAVAGGSYEVSARSSSGLPVRLSAGGVHAPCSFGEPPEAGREWHLAGFGGEQPPPERQPSPQTVSFDAAGTCTITAEAESNSEYEAAPEVSQSFVVVRDPSEEITFTSTAPSDATVGATYSPSVRTSAGLIVFFYAATPSVCRVMTQPFSSTVDLYAAGTCTIIASQSDNESVALEALEARQSFTVSSASSAATTSPEVKTTPTEVKKDPSKKAKRSPKGGIPAKVRAKLLKLALAEAARSGEHHPHEIQAVRTTEAEAHTLESAGRGVPKRYIRRRGTLRCTSSR